MSMKSQYGIPMTWQEEFEELYLDSKIHGSRADREVITKFIEKLLLSESVVKLKNKIMIHAECGTPAIWGTYPDGSSDWRCPRCDVTFLDDPVQTIIS